MQWVGKTLQEGQLALGSVQSVVKEKPEGAPHGRWAVTWDRTRAERTSEPRLKTTGRRAFDDLWWFFVSSTGTVRGFCPARLFGQRVFLHPMPNKEE